jgi:hypothetical protein
MVHWNAPYLAWRRGPLPPSLRSGGQSLIVVALVALATISSAAAASEQAFVSCWLEERIHPVTGETRSVTVCRLVDGEITEFPGEEPPGPVEPMVGTDANGACWYWTSAETDWEILAAFSDGSAVLGLYVNGFLALDTGQIPRCTTEPIPGEPPHEVAWEAITEYIHDPPEPELSPPIGLGLAGMETHAGFPVPGPWADTITIPGYVLDVEVVVTAATVDWGDEIVDTFPSEAYPQLTGYPDGLARHVYEAKTCTPPGSADDCHPDLEAYPVTISYEWGARWRANGGSWIDVAVPPSSTSVFYPVTEAVSSLTETG